MTGDSLFIVHGTSGIPSLAEAASQLHVPVETLDPSFGVQPIDPKAGDYAVMGKGGPAKDQDPATGPFSNPAIGSFGPPE